MTADWLPTCGQMLIVAIALVWRPTVNSASPAFSVTRCLIIILVNMKGGCAQGESCFVGKVELESGGRETGIARATRIGSVLPAFLELGLQVRFELANRKRTVEGEEALLRLE